MIFLVDANTLFSFTGMRPPLRLDKPLYRPTSGNERNPAGAKGANAKGLSGRTGLSRTGIMAALSESVSGPNLMKYYQTARASEPGEIDSSTM